jgi:hypothetical protein
VNATSCHRDAFNERAKKGREAEPRNAVGYPSRSTYRNWAKLAREHGEFTLDVDTLTRISAVLGIH